MAIWGFLAIITIAMLTKAGCSAAQHLENFQNLVENGSFEDFRPDRSTQKSNATAPTQLFYTVFPPSHSIARWRVTRSSVNWAKGWWQASPDGTPSAVDLNGVSDSDITTSVTLVSGVRTYTLIFFAGSHTSTSGGIGDAKVIAAFSVAVTQTCNDRRPITLNSTTVCINKTLGFERDNHSSVHWQSFSMVFNVRAVAACNSVDILFSSMTLGIYGPIIDGVGVYPGVVALPSPGKAQRLQPQLRVIAVSVTVALVSVMIAVALLAVYLPALRYYYQQQALKAKSQERVQIFGYDALKKATNNFDEACKLGSGGFGEVYKGILSDGTIVAIKQLKCGAASSRINRENEFLNEMGTISRAQHKNVVALKGFCLHRQHTRLLVYEYMPNGSLDGALFGEESRMEWSIRMRILQGTAKGLEYLHNQSQPRIIHRDVKTSNILLDDSFNAKVSDFGLAIIFNDGISRINTCTVAGTLGYLAPEYALRGQLTEKADVFSWGVVALEIVSGRRNTSSADANEDTYIVDWAWRLHGQGRAVDLVDARLHGDFPVEEAERVIKVALHCTRTDPHERPSMAHVLAFLNAEAPVPSLPYSPPHLFL